jgi:hypothetical protein
MMTTPRKPHRHVAALLALLTAGALALAPPPGAQTLPTGLEPEAVAANTCRYCGLVNKPGHYFCTRCARLFRTEASDTASRFWGDAFYVIHFPPLNEKPHLQADTSDGRLRVSFGKKGAMQIEGKIRAWTSAGTVDFKAEAIDTVDAAGRLTRREVHAIVKDSPTRHLYRRIEYQYAGEQRASRSATGSTATPATGRTSRPSGSGTTPRGSISPTRTAVWPASAPRAGR